jgi:RNA polymerase sigma factor (sigma-70 family)
MAFDAASEETDETLMRRYAGGDRAAARVLTLRYAPRVLALARRMLGDAAEAEDVAQEAMLRLWRVAPDWWAGEAAPATWLYRVTGNLCIDRLRRRRPMVAEAPETADPAPSVEAGLIAGDRARALEAALAALPERQRLAVVLRHFEERGNPEIAAILDTTVEAVESLLTRARRTLAERLLPQAETLGFER